MIWNWLFHRKSVREILKQVAKLLPLKDFEFNRYTSPAVRGDYFGFRITLEGASKKGLPTKAKGFRFLATIDLPQAIEPRVFLSHEKRKTSFKPVANLKLVTANHARFNQNFLLLASNEKKAAHVFQPYLCGKVTALAANDWQLDVHDETAHFELWQPTLNAHHLCEVLKVVGEVLNALLVATATV